MFLSFDLSAWKNLELYYAAASKSIAGYQLPKFELKSICKNDSVVKYLYNSKL